MALDVGAVAIAKRLDFCVVILAESLTKFTTATLLSVFWRCRWSLLVLCCAGARLLAGLRSVVFFSVVFDDAFNLHALLANAFFAFAVSVLGLEHV